MQHNTFIYNVNKKSICMGMQVNTLNIPRLYKLRLIP